MGTTEIVIVAIVVILVFGTTKLPQLGDGLGRAIKNFKRAVGGNNEIEVSPKKTSAELNDRAAPDAEVASTEKKTSAVK
jgi:sec-independent protein translocase protein TatA